MSMGAGLTWKSQHNYTCNSVAHSHHNLPGSPHSHRRRIRMLSCSTLHNCATFRKPPGFYKSVAHFYSCLHSDIRLHTLAQFQINSKLGKYYYLSYLLLHRQKTESHIWVNMCSRELQTECSGVVCLQWLDSWTLNTAA